VKPSHAREGTTRDYFEGFVIGTGWTTSAVLIGLAFGQLCKVGM